MSLPDFVRCGQWGRPGGRLTILQSDGRPLTGAISNRGTTAGGPLAQLARAHA